jgi:Tol biopolymer transport system component
MSSVARMHLLAPVWTGPLLLAVVGGVSCDSTAPGRGGSTGGLALVTTTAGIQPDNDGYTIRVDGNSQGTVGANDSVMVAGIDAGSHAIELADVEFNCATLGQFTRTVAVEDDAEAVVDYSIACDAVSRSRIAFVQGLNLDVEIFLVNADGSDVTSLKASLGAVFPEGGGALPPVRWSADGNRVAFVRADGALYVANADGTGLVQLAPAGTSPLWSEDGRVAFLALDQACCRNIFVAESDGSAVTQVTHGRSISHYDFAANGSMLAYESFDTQSRLFVVRPDGTGEREITSPDFASPNLPSLSPDGTKVAYSAYLLTQGDNGAGSEIYVTPTEGGGSPIGVSNNLGDDWWPVWSPDGTRIAFVSSAPGDGFVPGGLHVVNADGTGQINLTPVDEVSDPAWSPEGTRIAYTGVVRSQLPFHPAQVHVFVANADGSGRTDITPDSDSYLPTWTGR